MKLEIPRFHSLPDAVDRRERYGREGLKVVLTNGVFDLLHTGHLFFLREAAAEGDILFVALNADVSVRRLKGRGRPIQSEQERAFALSELRCVDTVIRFEHERLTKEIEALTPDVYVKAGDYSLETLHPGERAALERAGTEIRFLPFLPGFSTTGLIERIARAVAKA